MAGFLAELKIHMSINGSVSLTAYLFLQNVHERIGSEQIRASLEISLIHDTKSETIKRSTVYSIALPKVDQYR